MENGSDGKIIITFATLKAKTYSYLTGNNNEDQKQEVQKSA